MICIKSAYLECRIPERNRSAFYHLMAGRDLFGLVLIRHWGRIGTRGQPKLKSRFASEEEMLREFQRILQLRFRHGYRVEQHGFSG
ncbi:WGR domain-containing protein [Thermodesulfobacteriota bacterium B35]